jgi:hypothetical protein
MSSLSPSFDRRFWNHVGGILCRLIQQLFVSGKRRARLNKLCDANSGLLARGQGKKAAKSAIEHETVLPYLAVT